MKKFVIATVMTAALATPAGMAAAAPVAATAAANPVAGSTGSSSGDVFCAVIMFLKGGWIGRQTDCTF
ncbi:MAG: hypothetical protein JWN03_4760 [Nocardia sp.]|uniref:hypothetical protein n=1 Tax=Nocardia sp. TaxID=1821 RepID=UPI0026061E77|nr:hypothetical protein [Nocardia sp.]MCU1644485.1 hypothetical protein [Nocardia sp.]